MSHEESVQANIKAARVEKYDQNPSIDNFTSLFARSFLEFDFDAPRKTLGQTQAAIESKEIGRLLADVVPRLKSGTIIDFACGTGQVAEKMAPHFTGEIVGVDISPQMLSKFETRAEQVAEKYSGLKMRSICGDILDPTFDLKPLIKYADFLICTLAFHHIHSYKEVAAVLKTMVKPGGWILIYDFYNEDLEIEEKARSGHSHAVTSHGLNLQDITDCLQEGCVNVSACREFRAKVWQEEQFIKNHCQEKVIQLLAEAPRDGDLYLVECSIVLGVAQVK